MIQRRESLLRLGADHAQGDHVGKVDVAHDGATHHPRPIVLFSNNNQNVGFNSVKSYYVLSITWRVIGYSSVGATRAQQWVSTS